MSVQIRIDDGELQTPAAAGFAAGTFTHAHGGGDGLVLTAPQGIDDADLIPLFKKVEIFQGGVRRFCGWLDTAPIQADGGSERRAYRISGPMRWLARASFAQADRRLVTLGRDGSLRKPLLAQVTEILTAAAAKYPGRFAFDPAGITEADGALPIFWELRYDEKCATLLDVCMRWVCGVTFWWDYAPELPTLRFVAFENAATAALTESTKITINPDRRTDMLADKVTISYLLNLQSVDVPVAVDSFGQDEESDAAAAEVDREETLSIPLQANEPPPAPGLAENYWRYISRLHADVDFTEPSFAWDIAPGLVYSYGGALAHLDPARSQVQVIERDLFAETAAVQAGVPRHLGLGDLYSLIRRRAMARQSSGGGGAGGPVDDDEDPEWEPCTVNVLIKDYQNEPIPGAYAVIKGTVIQNENSAEFEMTASAENDVKVFVWVPPQFKAPDEPSEITLLAGEEVEAEEEIEYREELKLVKAVSPEGDLASKYARMRVIEGNSSLTLENRITGPGDEVFSRKIELTTEPENSSPSPTDLAFDMRPRLVSGVHAGALAWRWLIASETVGVNWD